MENWKFRKLPRTESDLPRIEHNGQSKLKDYKRGH